MYRAYGLCIQSEFQVPDLYEMEPQSKSEQADINISIGAPDWPNPLEPLKMGEYFAYSDSGSRFCISVANVANFWVEDGTSIRLEPKEGASEQEVAVFLTGCVLGALLYQRGLTLLHGNCLRIENRAVVCLGNSGAGKSTLAAQLVQNGAELISDDLVAITTDDKVLPGISRIKLWDDSLHALAIEEKNCRKIFNKENKYILDLAQSKNQDPLDISVVFILSNEHSANEELQLKELTGYSRLFQTKPYFYRPEIRSKITKGSWTSEQLLRISATKPVYKARNYKSRHFDEKLALSVIDLARAIT